jgi:hypothetical protein
MVAGTEAGHRDWTTAKGTLPDHHCFHRLFWLLLKLGEQWETMKGSERGVGRLPSPSSFPQPHPPARTAATSMLDQSTLATHILPPCRRQSVLRGLVVR